MNIKDTKEVIKGFPNAISIILKGNHGIGKSEVVAQCAQEIGIDLVDIRLSQKEVGDVIGMPSIENGTTIFNKPKWWPKNPKSKGILLFDELNRATRDVLQAVFEIVLDRKLNLDPLPEGWKVIACVNDNSDIYQVIDLDPALQDRFFNIDFRPTSEEWLQWAQEKVHDSIWKFISKNDSCLDTPSEIEPNTVSPSRRSWVMFSKCIDNMQGLFENKVMLIKICAGFVGANTSILYQKFIEQEYNQIKGIDILLHFGKIKNHLEKATVPEIAALSKFVIKDFNEVKSHQMSTAKENIKKFIVFIPQETASNFWSLLLDKDKKIAEELITKDSKFNNFILDIWKKEKVKEK